MPGNIRISQLPEVTSVQPSDIGAFVASGTTSKISVQNLSNSLTTVSSSISSSYAATASSAQTLLVTGDITASNALITGTIVAQKLNVQYITSSTQFITGSTKFGSQLSDNHQFTGSVLVTGSLSLNNSPVVNNTVFTPFSSSVSTRTANLETTSSVLTTASASFAQASSSFSTRTANLETTASVLTTASSSFSTRTTNLESTASVLTTASASFAQISGSNSTRITNLETTASVLTTASASFAQASASFSARTVNLETTASVLTTASASFAQASGSNSTRITNLETTASVLTTASSSFAQASGSISNRVTIIEGKYLTTGSNSLTGSQVISGSLIVTGSLLADNFTGSLFGTSSWANQAITSSYVTGSIFSGNNLVLSSSYSISSSFSYTASSANSFVVRQDVTASNMLLTGTLVAQTINVQQVTSSVIYSSGSNRFGNLLTDVQQMTGSLRVTGSGNHFLLGANLGIATNSPTAKLHVSGSINAETLLLVESNTRATGLFVSSSGNVGIGTTNPTSLLHVTGSPASLGVIARFNTNTSSGSIGINHAGNGGFIGYANIGASDQNNVFYVTTGVGTIGSGIVMNNAGNLGLGTCTPGQKFHVVGVSCLDGYNYASSFQFFKANCNTASPQTGNGALVFSAGNSQIRIDTNNGMNFDAYNGGTVHSPLILRQCGNTVRVNSPNNTLSLALAYVDVEYGYLGATSGNSGAVLAYSVNGGYVYLKSDSTWVAASDINRKKNFSPYTKGLSAISGLNPVYYQLKTQDDTAEKSVGLIAQEVGQVLSEAYSDDGDFVGVGYNVILVTMINAIKELKAELENANARITTLENK